VADPRPPPPVARRSAWARLRARPPDDDPTRTFLVALAVALVCATVVSTTALALRPRQRANREAERRAQLRDLVARLPGADALLAGAGEVEALAIDLETGAPAPSIDPATFDPRRAAADPAAGVAIPAAADVAGLERRARHAVVYVVKDGRRVELVVLPVEGSGYGGPIRGFVALGADANTILALSFFEHLETPGVGARIDDPAWRARWQGKRARDAEGRLRVGVATERLDPSDAPHQVDGISGATITSEAVGNLLRYWLGDHGYGPFLRTLR
jgi:Na+-transporting NADH:ubiquinone oxidoreductase subunit C